mgnify:CR=1 FL=1
MDMIEADVRSMRFRHLTTRICWCMVALLFITSVCGSMCSMAAKIEVQSERAVNRARLWIVSIPGLSFHELDWLQAEPRWRELTASAAFAAMNVRTPVAGIEDVYLSIGAGAPTTARREDQGYRASEWVKREEEVRNAALLHERFSGVRAKEAAIVVPTFSYLEQWNRAQPHSALPGLLGNLLKDHGIARAVFGNRDRTLAAIVGVQTHARHAPLMLVDQNGLVDAGMIGAEMLEADPGRPFGVKTRYSALLSASLKQDGPSVMLVELGDLERLYAEKEMYADGRFEPLKHTILTEMVSFLADLKAHCDDEDGIWIFSPMSHADARKDKSLVTPFFVIDHQFAPGRLLSATTRRPGLISYLDLAPSILERFGIRVKAPEMRGSGIENEDTPGTSSEAKNGASSGTDNEKDYGTNKETIDETYSEWLQEIRHIENVYRLRSRFSYPYIFFQAGVLLLGLWHVFVPFKGRVSALIRAALMATLAAPLILLLLGKYPGLPHAMFIALFGGGLVLVGFILSRLPTLSSLFIVGALTALLILLDGLFGAELMKRSVLGYDPVIGARFYGIGNEFMGVLIGASLLALAVWRQMSGKERMNGLAHFAFLIVYVPVLIFLVAPFWGTNAGGAIAASIAYAAFWILLRKYADHEGKDGSKWKSAGAIAVSSALALVVALLALWFFNAGHTNDGTAGAYQSSHIGKAFHALVSGRFDLIADLVWRKLAMNVRLIGVSFWSKLLASGLLTLIVTTIYIRRGKSSSWPRRLPYVACGSAAITIGAFAAFLVNDSGLVAAATMIVYAAVPVLLFSQRSDSHSV